MKDFLQAIKKFLKIALIVALVLFVGIGLYTAFDNHKDKVARTVDKEIGFKCLVSNDKKNIRFILGSSPVTRKTEIYYDKGYIVGYEKSDINDTKEAKLQNLEIIERTVDYIYINAGKITNFKLNRKNLELSLLSVKSIEYKDYTVDTLMECTEVEPKEIRDFVKEVNAEANATNKV